MYFLICKDVDFLRESIFISNERKSNIFIFREFREFMAYQKFQVIVIAEFSFIFTLPITYPWTFRQKDLTSLILRSLTISGLTRTKQTTELISGSSSEMRGKK